MTMTGSAVDEDEGSDGDIFEVTVATKTDLITIKQAFEVVMKRAITLEDLKNGELSLLRVTGVGLGSS